MKNIRLIAFLFGLRLFVAGPVCLYAESKAAAVSFRTDYDIDKSQIITSSKLNFPFCEFCASGKFDCKDLLNGLTLLKWNYGAELSTQKLIPKLEMNFKVGQLSSSGSISRLNSPALSSLSSAFTPSSVNASKLQTALPQYNSFSSDQSYSFEIFWKPNNTLKQLSFNMFYKTPESKDNTLTLNAFIKVVPAKKIELSYSSTGGLYSYSKKNVTTWFSDELFYREGEHLCLNNQFQVMLGSFSSLFILSTYQSPFGDFLNTWRTENLIKFKRFSFNLDSFYNPENQVITSSGKLLNPLLQISAGGQYKFLTETSNRLTITSGINTQADINLCEQKHTMKTIGGIRYSGGFGTGSLTTSINLNLTNQNDGIKTDFGSGSIQTSHTIYFTDFYPSISGKFSFTPDSKKINWTFSEELGLNFEYKPADKKISFSNKNKITFTQKNKDFQKKMSFTSSLSVKAQFRFCSLHVHLEFQV